MSYPSGPNYYGPSSVPQKLSSGYATAGHGSERLNLYQDTARSTDHNRNDNQGQNSYGWPYQSQVNATDTQYGYTTDAWRDQSNPSAAKNLPQDRYAPSRSAQTQSHSFSPRDTYNGQNTLVLNHLAYASGLEPPVTGNINDRSLHKSGSNVYGIAATGDASPARISSSVNNAPEHLTKPSQIPSSGHNSGYSSFQTNESPASTSNANLAPDAAAALAGAMRGMHPHSSQLADSSSTNRMPDSSVVSTGQFRPQSPGQRTVTDNLTAPTSGHSRKASNQPRPSTSTQSKNILAKARSDTTMTPQPQPRSTIPQNQSPAPSERSHKQAQASNPQNISNLVNASGNDPEQIYNGITTQDPTPSYINPTQVFNPYHRGYERKRREAAEVQAKLQAGVAQQQNVERQKETEQAAKRAPENPTPANSKSKITKKDAGVGSKENDSTHRQRSASTASTTVNLPDEDAMAMELQKMMTRMKEFRNTNPSLFQRLWNDMRGNNSATTPAVGTALQSPSPQATEVSLSKAVPFPKTNEKDPTPAKSTPNRPGNKGEIKGIPADVPLNGFKVVVEDNAMGLPDLGRFPAERRIRQPYVKQKSDASADADAGSSAQQSLQPRSEELATGPMQTFMEDAKGRPIESTSTWPESRREIVAVALVQYLRRTPSNDIIPITAHDVSSILKRNPTYLDLCTSLESKGFRFARSGLAKELLKAVPDLHASPSRSVSFPSKNEPGKADLPLVQARSSSSLPPSDGKGSARPAPYAELDVHGSQGKSTIFSQGAPAKNLPNTVTIEPTKPLKHSSKASKGAIAGSKSEPPVGSKEAASRKRDFSELIDLTEIVEDDNYVLPTKQPRLDPDPSSDLFAGNRQNGLTTFNPENSEPLRFNPMAQPQTLSISSQTVQRPRPSNPLPVTYYPDGLGYNVFSKQGIGRDSNKPRLILARQLDRSEALKKSYYDPRTVARDVLIASGRHKSERSLNVHLAELLGLYIELDSDVSTLDWDSIDPGGPPLPKVEYADVPAAPPRFKLGERIRRKHRKHGHSDKTRSLEKEKPKSRPASNSPDRPLSSKLADPLPHTETEGKQTLRKQRRRNDSDLTVGTNVTSTARNISIDIPSGHSQQLARSDSQRPSSLASKMDSDTPLTVKRRGRPPGAKNKYPSIAGMKQQARAAIAEVPVVEEAPEANLHSYRCKWVKCHAELHNLDTLRRHVTKKHSPNGTETEKDGFVCWWKKCPYLKFVGTGNVTPTRTFPNQEEWLHHIEEEHIRPVAEKYGDGPKTKDIDPQTVERFRTQYLSDTYGRATTPLSTPDGNADHPPDAMVLTKVYPQGPKSDREKADITAQNAFMKAHGNRHRDTRKAAEEVVRAMEVRKQKIGPGLDRGGCTLINEARRSTFEQAPGVSRVVDAGY